MSKRYVYFIRPIGQEGPIKIGCSQAPQKRLETMIAWSPIPLEIVATVSGGFDLETKLHRRFCALHSHYEWFTAGPELVAVLAKIKAGVPVDRAVDFSVDDGPLPRRRAPLRPEMKRCVRYQRKLATAVRRAEKAKGTRQRLPARADAILDSWRQYDRDTDKCEYTPPPQSDIQYLEEVIADPLRHCEVWLIRRAA